VNGTDTFLLDATPDRNYGPNGTLWVGRDAGIGSVARSLVRFDLGSIPPGGTVVDAALELNGIQDTPGSVEVRRAIVPWTEGTGGGSTYGITVTVTETDGVVRLREPVVVPITFLPNSEPNPVRDVRVWRAGIEVPSQVNAVTMSGGYATSARVVFGATVGAGGVATYTITYGPGPASVPAYRTKTFSPTPLWTYGPTGGGASGASVVDLDGDGGLDLVFGTADGYVRAVDVSGGTPALLWATRVSGSNSVPYTPQVADLEGDGALDIVVFANSPAVHRLTRTGVLVWNVSYQVGSIPVSAPTLLDVDDDGILDVLVPGRSRQVDALDGQTGALLRSYLAGDIAYATSIADITGDGRGEIFFASDDRLVHAYARDGTELWASAPATAQFLETAVALGDLDRDGAIEAVTADDVTNGPVFAQRAATGASAWSVTLANQSWREGGLTLADLDGDGTLETLLPIESGSLFALRATDGATIWEYYDDHFMPLYPAVVDVTNDGFPDIVYAEEGKSGVSSLRILDKDGGLVRRWNTTQNDPGLRTLSQFHMTSPAIADLDADGTLEIVVPTGDGLEAYGTGSLAPDWRTWGYNWNHTHTARDGNTPDGRSALVVDVGSTQVVPPAGASWMYRDGTSTWATPGGDFGTAEATAVPTTGWISWNVTGIVADWLSGTFPNVGLALVEVDEAGGGLHAFASSDDADPAVRPRLTVTVAYPTVDPVPAIAGTIPSTTRGEDAPPWATNLAGFAYDEDTPMSDLRWNLSGVDAAVIQVTGTNVLGNHILTFYPVADAWGSMRVTYWLADPQGNIASQDAWINVTPVNDPPAFAPPSTFIVRYNQTYTFDFDPYVSDVDDPQGDLVLSTDDPVRAAVSGLNVSFLYPEDLLGTWVFVTLTVSDGAASVSRAIAVKVTADNPPVLQTPLPDLTLVEGELRIGVFDLDDHFLDPDADTLYFSEGYSHLNITIWGNHSVDVWADADWSGWERVTFRGEDPLGAIAEDTIIVTVLPVDDPPVLGAIPDLRVRYDETYLFNLAPYIEDPDTPMGSHVVTTSSPYIAVSGHVLTLLYPFALNGTVETVNVSVSDGTTTVTQTIRVTVGDDRPPRLTAKLPDRAFPEDGRMVGAYDLTVFFEDPDSAALYYSSGQRNVRIDIGANGSVDLSADPDWYGTERITFRATDSDGALAEDTVWITVLPVNDAPAIRTIPDQVYNTTSVFLDLTAYLSDVESNVTDLELSTANAFGRIVGQGILFTFPGDVSEVVQVVVSDGDLSTATSFTVAVRIPGLPGIPAYVYWIGGVGAAGAFAAFVVYRRRKIEWAFLVTNPGLLVCSVSRREPTALDTDLLTGMLTAIMDFARKSFSDEKERTLEGLELGDRRVAIVRGDVCYVAVVYGGRTPGSLLRILRSLLALIESRYRASLGDIIDTSELGDIPHLMERLVYRGWWPFLRFDDGAPAPREDHLA
jgi:hypothetical protein